MCCLSIEFVEFMMDVYFVWIKVIKSSIEYVVWIGEIIVGEMIAGGGGGVDGVCGGCCGVCDGVCGGGCMFNGGNCGNGVYLLLNLSFASYKRFARSIFGSVFWWSLKLIVLRLML